MQVKEILASLTSSEDSIATTIARLSAGLVMLPHGLAKTLGLFGGGGISGTLDFMSKNLGIPPALGLLAIIAESVGAIGLIIGWQSRICAMMIAVTMLVAWLMAHAQYGFFMNWYGNQKGEGFEYHLLMIGLCLVVMIAGSGKYGIDYALQRNRD